MWESMEQIIEKGQAHRAQVAALSQMQLQAMERVEAQERELRRLSALLVEHQAILRSLAEIPHQQSPETSPPHNLAQLRGKLEDVLPGTVNTIRGAAGRTSQVPDLGKLPMLRRDTFEDISADEEEEVSVTPQRWVRFANVATSTPVPRPVEQPRERTQSSRVSQVPSTDEGLFKNPEPQRDLFEKGFSHSLQATAMEFKKLKRAEGGQI